MDINKLFQHQGVPGIKQTLKAMRTLILLTDQNRIIKTKAKEIVADISPNDELGQINAIFSWVQKNMKYVRDIYGVEELTRPDRVVYNILNGEVSHSSDCDDYAMLLSALLRSIGFSTRVEAVAVQTTEGYDHARAAVFSRVKNEWLVLEGTRPGVQPGFRLPSKLEILAVEVY